MAFFIFIAFLIFGTRWVHHKRKKTFGPFWAFFPHGLMLVFILFDAIIWLLIFDFLEFISFLAIITRFYQEFFMQWIDASTLIPQISIPHKISQQRIGQLLNVTNMVVLDTAKTSFSPLLFYVNLIVILLCHLLLVVHWRFLSCLHFDKCWFLNYFLQLWCPERIQLRFIVASILK